MFFDEEQKIIRDWFDLSACLNRSWNVKKNIHIFQASKNGILLNAHRPIKTVELNNGFSCWWISLFFICSLPHYEKMMSKPPTDAIAGTPLKKYRNKLELTVFYLRIRITEIYKWSWKYIYSFLIIIQWFCASCGVVRYQSWSRGMRRILILNGAARWYTIIIQEKTIFRTMRMRE